MSFSSNSVIAKARSVFGRLLTAEDYQQLCSKATVAEAAAYLKQTEHYGEILAGVNLQNIHRGQLEALIQKSIFGIFERFFKFDHSESRSFFRYIVMELEAEQVLTAIECVDSGSADRYIAELPMFLVQHSEMDLLALGKAKSFMDIVGLLENTKFIKPLRPLLVEAAETGRINIRECERRILTFYYMSCLKNVKKIYGDKKGVELKKALLKSIDMINVVTCCRMNAFGCPPDSIKAAVIPFKYRLSDEVLERLLQLKDIDRIQQELDSIGYRVGQSAEFSNIEQLTERISDVHLKRMIRMSQNSAAVYYALIECLKVEQRNIKTIIEGIRYGLPSGEILDMLVI